MSVHEYSDGDSTAPLGASATRAVYPSPLLRLARKSALLLGICALSMGVAMPGTGSSVADATLTQNARSALVLAALGPSSPATRIMTDLSGNAAPVVRMARLRNPETVDPHAQMRPVMRLHDTLTDEQPHEVDLSRLHQAWLTQFAPAASLRPMPRVSSGNLSSSGTIAASLSISPNGALDRSLLPIARPEGLSRRVVQYSRSWLRNVALRTPTEQETCLSTAIYHEARGETLKGQFAVAEVILNRVASRRFPNTICEVVYQGVRPGQRGGCQFSFACDGKPETLHNRAAASLAQRIAQVMADGGHRGLTGGALYFHTTEVEPVWSRRMTQTTRIGAHLFYRG